MKTLKEIQNEFGRVIRGDDTAGFSENVIPGGKLSAESALQVYQEGYSARLASLLGETYEAVWRVLGDEEFFKTCLSYVACENSRSYNLSDYGENFPEYLRLNCREFPWISDLAAFEWNFKNVFHEESILPADLTGTDFSAPEKLHFEIGKDVRIIKSSHAVFDIWNHRSEEKYNLPDDNKINQEENGFLYKKDGQIYFEKMPLHELEVLEDLMRGKSLSVSLDGKDALDEESVMKLFSTIVSSGIIKSVVSGSSSEIF